MNSAIRRLCKKARTRCSASEAARPAGSYWLASDELLEYPAFHGLRGICHLFIYTSSPKQRLCIVGNFDGTLSAPTTNVIEAVATAVAKRLRSEQFRLIEWYPRRSGNTPFSEVVLKPMPATVVAHGQTIITDGDKAKPGILQPTRHATTASFANPRWVPVSKRQLAELLGHDALYELHAMAGIKGDYAPERLFGTDGRRLADEIRAHNDAQVRAILAQVKEWTTGPSEQGE